MTQVYERPQRRASFQARTSLEVAVQQLTGIDRFNRVRQVEEAAVAGSLSREQRLTRDRQRDVVRRKHDAIVARCDDQLRLSAESLSREVRRRVVVAHRSEWFVDKIAVALAEQGVEVVVRLDNGADAVGAVIAEQPDLLLVEDSLAMVPGEQVVREVRLFSPSTVIMAHVAYADRLEALLEAGASAVFTRQIPPLDVAQAVVRLLVCESD